MLNNAWYGSGPLTLVDGRLFSFPRAFGWVEATPSDFLPAFTTQALPRATPVTILPGDTDSEAVDLPHQFDYVGGEVSVFYGRSLGKSKREVVQGSFLGEVVDGNTHDHSWWILRSFERACSAPRREVAAPDRGEDDTIVRLKRTHCFLPSGFSLLLNVLGGQ